MIARALCWVCSSVLIVGCAGAPKESIPTYPLMDVQQSLAAMQQRNEGVESITGEGTVTMFDAKGGSVRLDAAFAFALPNATRIRAYKFGQAVLDLTVKSEEVWLYLPRQDGRAQDVRKASRSVAGAVELWLQLLGGGAAFGSWDTAGNKFIITDPRDRTTMRLEIDRRTLTFRRCAMFGDEESEQFTLDLDRYRQVGNTVWPGRIKATSASGTILIEMRDVELNAAPPAAFQPPPRAERLP
jgi:outer membrane lipoprotein-sorting protein